MSKILSDEIFCPSKILSDEVLSDKVHTFIFTDILECNSTHACDGNATCSDGNGSYTCLCDDGYTGDGFTCKGKSLMFLNPKKKSLYAK